LTRRGAIIAGGMTARDPAEPQAPPTGTVTFFFSDIEGSTRLLERLGAAYADVLQRHREVMRRAFAEHGGIERGTEGDSFFVAFADAAGAVAAAADATKGLAAAAWPAGATVRVRIGMHTGEGRLVDGDYVGLDVHRAARIAAAGHGGQIVISQSTQILIERALPLGASLQDLGEHHLKDLQAPEHLYQVVIDGLPGDFPPLRSLDRTVANLPAQLSTIVGRDGDVAAVRDLLHAARLVTITGPGGTGKTRLAQEVARDVVATPGLPAGATDVVFVPLQALMETDLIPIEILRALHLDVAAVRDPIERVVSHLASRRTLLVLDNLEQLDGAGRVIRSLLDAAPTLAIVAASQAALHVEGEREYALGTLPVPSAAPGGAVSSASLGATPAVQLFVDRARAVRADFMLDDSNAGAVLAICARLDGLPLAIELAAAQVKVLSPAAILDRISGRIDTLTSRRDDLPERHRTLRATVAWSYELLGEPERRLFRRLGAFVGGARLAEIEAIAAGDAVLADPVEALATLVDRSLVAAHHGTSADDDRFLQLQTVLSFGREILRDVGEEAAVLDRHAEIYRDLARRAEPEFYGRSRRAWLDRLAQDHDNLRAALDHLRERGHLDDALNMAADLWRFWQQRGYLVEARDRLDELLAQVDSTIGQDGAPGVDLIALSRAEEALGSVLYWTRVNRRAPWPYYERALQHAIQSGDRHREALARYNLAFVYDFTPNSQGNPPDLARATELRTAALAVFRELGDRRAIADSLWALGGNSLVIAVDADRSRSTLMEAEAAFEELGNTTGMAWAAISLGMLDVLQGNLDSAEARMLRAVELFDDDTAGDTIALEALGAIAAKRGDDRTAVRYRAAAVTAARASGAEPPQIPPIIEPLDAAAARMSAEEIRREEGLGAAIGMRSILTSLLETWRARGGASAEP
jgi:predicted ATPase/class 3 adenylate cyclase